MRSVETVAIILFAVVISGIFLTFLFTTNYNGIFDYTMSIFNKAPKEAAVPLVNLEELAQKMDSCWNDCKMGSIELNCGTVNISTSDFNPLEIEEGITKERLSFFTKKYSYCDNCNFEIDSESGKIKANTLLQINCSSSSNNILLIQ